MRYVIGFLVLLSTLFCNQFTQAATFTCNSCSDCSSKLQAATSGDSVTLTTDLQTDSGSSCINFGSVAGVIFDGGNHVISHGSSGNYGIYLGSSSNTGNTLENIEVRGFSRGIYIVYGSGNTIANSRIIGNNSGIEMYSASSNIIEGCTIKQNFTGIYVEYNSDANIVRNSYITKNNDSGITFFPRLSVGDPENNQVYNNVLSNTSGGNIKITTISTETDRDLGGIPFIFNSALACDQGANIMGCGCQGGNYWGLPFDLGFSQTCTDSDNNGICDTAYTIAHDTAVMVDNYPLSVPPAGCCVNTDRDQDGYTSKTCGGNDFDDDPLLCGATCHLGASEICDGYDNDQDGIRDGTLVCQDMLLYKQAMLSQPIADQSCVEAPNSHKIFCFGGRTYGDPWYLDSITSYDPANDTVENLATKLPARRSDLSCSYAPTTKKIFCFGGYWQETICTQWDENGGCISAYSISHYLNDILEFNPTDESITTLPVTLPVGMDGMSTAWSRQTSTIFVIGGTSSIHSGDRDSILEFDPVTKILSTRSATLPSPRYNHSCSENSETGNIYCFGGYGTNGGLAEIVEFNPSANSVSLMNATFATDIYDTPCVEDSVDHLFYCLSGRNHSYPYYLEGIQVYDPAADTLMEKSSKFIFGRFGHSCVENTATNKIYCFGGSRNVVDLSEISEYTPNLPILGDVNNSGVLDLTDLILSLQLTTGFSGQGVNRKSDVGGDRKLGLEEAIYILKRTADL